MTRSPRTSRLPAGVSNRRPTTRSPSRTRSRTVTPRSSRKPGKRPASPTSISRSAGCETMRGPGAPRSRGRTRRTRRAPRKMSSVSTRVCGSAPRAAPRAIARRSIQERLARLGWEAVARSLDERGCATTPALLDAGECAALVRLSADERRFRSRIDMARLRFGVGEYRYFATPLPPLVAALRAHLYRHLAPIANRWMEAMGVAERFPPDLGAYLARCAAH